MEYLKELSVAFSAFCSIVAFVGSILLLTKKLKPTGRKYRDWPELWVFIGFWSYVAIHWGLPYGYWMAARLPDEGPQVTFWPIEKSTISMITNSIDKLKELDDFNIGKVEVQTNGDENGERMADQIGLSGFQMTISGFKSEVSTTEICAQSFVNSLQFAKPNDCVFKLFASSNEILTVVKKFTQTIEVIDSEMEKGEPAIKRIATEMIEVVASNTVWTESGENSKKRLDEKKGLLNHLVSDLKKMEKSRKALLEELEPKTVDKIRMVREMTYVQIYAPLAISFLIYLGFSRVERWFEVRWHARFCAIAIVLSGLNIFYLSAFIMRLSFFSCPAEVDNISMDQFTSTWKSPFFDSKPTKICRSKTLTLFADLDHRVGFPITIDQVANEMATELHRFGTTIESLKIEYQSFLNTIADIEKLLVKLKLVGEGCSETQDRSKLDELIGALESLLEKKGDIKKTLNDWNETISNGTKVVMPIFQSSYEEAKQLVDISIKDFEDKVAAVDITCDSIDRKIKQCRRLICLQLDVQLGEYWLVIDFVLFLLLVLFSLNVVTYRTITLWQLELQSPPPPPPPQQRAQVLRRYRARRLEANLF